jgi:hypothetical protein
MISAFSSAISLPFCNVLMEKGAYGRFEINRTMTHEGIELENTFNLAHRY